MNRHDDDRLLDDLTAALSPPPASPTSTELVGLRRAVAFRFDPKHGAPRRSWSRRPVYLLAAAVIFTSTTAVALTGGLPAPIRSLARAAGLSIDSTALVQAKGALAEMRDALATNQVDAVQKAALELRASLKQLEANELRAIEAEASALLAEADRLLSAPAPKPMLDKAPLPQLTSHPPSHAPRPMAHDEHDDERDEVEEPEEDEEEDPQSIDPIDEAQIEQDVLNALVEVEKELRSPSFDGLLEERVREHVSKEVERHRKEMERSLEELERKRKDIERRRKDVERMREEIEQRRKEIEQRREEIDEEEVAPGPLPEVEEEEIDPEL